MNYIPWILSGIATLFTILTYSRNGHRDSMKDKAENDAKLESLKESLLKANVKLDQVCNTTNETRNDIKSLNTSIMEMDKRLSVVENDLKTAFMRIDELREEVKNNDK
jgi:peptidoglycan hydrolase CwlO-like protein